MNGPVITIDLRLNFGRPSIEGIPADALSSRVIAGEPVASVARDYDLTRDQVLVACWWEVQTAEMQRRSTKAERQLVDRWGDWADEALLILGGHRPGPCPDPTEVTS